jgi:hypothetical protein
MRFTGLHIGLLLLIAAGSALAGIAPGDTAAEVRRALGEPEGYLRAEGYELLYYERGKVELREGVVTAVNLVTEEEARALRQHRRREAARQREAEARRRSRLIVEGEEALAVLLTDPEFLSASAERQVARWRRFARRYPYTPLPDQYADALERLAEQREREAHAQRIAALEDRVRDAERKAEEAEFRARNAWMPATYTMPYVVTCQKQPRCRRPCTCRRRTPRSGLTVRFGRTHSRSGITFSYRSGVTYPYHRASTLSCHTTSPRPRIRGAFTPLVYNGRF